ncbi:MAG: ABC transporter ATP-binding protein [Planctomycetota bacterium]
MVDDVVIAAKGLGKKFARSLKRSFVYGARDLGRALLGRRDDDRLRPTEFWAVRDVSLTLRRGRSIGIVGHNGSGKTTLLRMVCGILRPNLGEVAVRGRIAPMLALGAGFKPVLSGRQNVFLNLALLGVSEREARRRLPVIVDYAELHDAIDAPLGTYSSGMQARLGFACAVHTEPSILVVDEVLSVGDARFRVKCRNTINELRRNGCALLLVSHSPVLVETLSDECLYLQGGRTVAFGPAGEVLRRYAADDAAQAAAGNAAKTAALRERAPEPGRRVAVRGVELRSDGRSGANWATGAPGELVVALRATAATEPVSVNVMLFDLVHQVGETVQLLMSSRDLGWLRLPAGDSEVTLALPHVGLRPGSYRLKVSVSSGALHDILDVVDDVRVLVTDDVAGANAAYFQPRAWRCPTGTVVAAPPATDGDDPGPADEG